MNHKQNMFTFPRWQIAVLSLFVLCVLAGGGWFYLAQESRVRQAVENDLESIANLKVAQIAQWRRERFEDIAALLENPLLEPMVKRWAADPVPGNASLILDQFRPLQKHHHYRDVLMADPDGTIRLSLRDRHGRIHKAIMNDLSGSQHPWHPALVSLYDESEDLPLQMDVAAPMITEDGKTKGVLVLQIDPNQFLYPFIKSWPVKRQSAETLLVCRDGDNVLYLNDLRYLKNSAMKLRIPLSRTRVPAVMAVLGRQGVVYGKDYRDVNVISVLKAVPDSPWFMVAKIDEKEAFATWRFESAIILLILAGFLAGVGVCVLMILQRRRKQHFLALYKLEVARRDNEELWRTTLVSVGDAIIVTDTDGKVRLLNPPAEFLTGWKQHEAGGRQIEEVFQIISEDTRRPAGNPVRRVLHDGAVVGQTNHKVLVSRDGIERPITDRSAPIRDAHGIVAGVVLVFQDQTAERAASRALKRESDTLRAIVATAPVGMLVIDKAGCVIIANPASERLFQEKLEGLDRKRCGDLVGCSHRHKNDRGCGFTPECPACALNNAVKAVLADSDGVFDQEAEFSREAPGGVVRLWLKFSVAPVIFDGEKHALVTLADATATHEAITTIKSLLDQNRVDRVALLGTLEDVRHAEARLRESEERYRTLFDDARDGIALAETETGILVDCNVALCLMVEREKTELLGQHQGILHPHEDGENRQSLSFRIHMNTPGKTVEDLLVSKSGNIIRVEISGSRILMNGREYIMGAFRDITERKVIEERLLRTQRLESIGVLASGIAHDLNNVLVPLGMGVDIMREHLTSAEDLKVLDMMALSAGRGANIVKQILTFARGMQGKRGLLQTKHLFRNVISIISGTFPKTIEIITDISPDLFPVMGDATQLEQVFMNLVINARDAMPEGGLLTIKAENCMVDDHFAALNPGASPGPHIAVSVKDNGQGIPQDVLPKIFDPFFTTKEVGKGSGLGLSTAHGIVQGHGGFMTVSSETGRGSEFMVYLPTSAEKEEVLAPAGTCPRGNGELILVVDDEASLRAVIRATLQNNGFRVLLADNGSQATTVFTENKGEIRAVVMDVGMPVMDGFAASRAIRDIEPAIPILLMTGAPGAAEEVVRARIPAVMKPFSKEELLFKLRELLDKRPAE